MANDLKKRLYEKNNYNENDWLESKINHRIEITNVFSLVN